MAKRYTEKKKQEVVDFVLNYDKKHGRGGKAAAKEKFGVNVNSIRNWMAKPKKAPVAKPGKAPVAARKKRGSTAPKARALASNTRADVLEKMVRIQGKIDSLNAEFKALKAKL